MASQYTRDVCRLAPSTPPLQANANAILGCLRTSLLSIIIVSTLVVTFAQQRGSNAGTEAGATASQNCFMLAPLEGAAVVTSDARECELTTAPASTFKIPHALIALETGVIDPSTVLPWDGTAYEFESWRHDHTLESAIRSSVYPFFRKTAALIGADRMHRMLTAMHYAADTFDGEISEFWTNGDLVVSPREQLTFLQRLFSGALPIASQHVKVVSQALVMPAGQISNASGLHAFPLRWPAGTVVRAKTGNTTVGGERVSWLVGSLQSGAKTFVFASRVRVRSELPGTAGAELALHELNRQADRQR